MKTAHVCCSLITILTAVFAVPALPGTSKQLSDLVLRVPVSAELTGGESHAYRVILTAEQYAYVVVDQRGIDVAVKVVDPDGRQLTEVDSPNGKEGPEP